NFGKDKGGQDILGAFEGVREDMGLGLKQVEGAEKRTLTLEGELKTKVEAKITLENDLASQLTEQIVKPIEDAIRRALASQSGAVEMLVRRITREQIEAADNDRRASQGGQR